MTNKSQVHVKPHRWWSLKEHRNAKDLEKLIEYEFNKAKDELVAELSKKLEKVTGL